MTRRGQLVLVAAVLAAVAVATLVVASLQLGYHGDVRASADYDDPTAETVRVLERAVPEASADVPRDYPWARQGAAVDSVRATLQPTLDRLRAGSVTTGIVRNVSYNTTAVADRRCPSGPDRAFGACQHDRGVLVQERVGRTHVLAVGFDVTVTTRRGETSVTVVVPVVG